MINFKTFLPLAIICSLFFAKDGFTNDDPFTLELETVTISGTPSLHSFAYAQSNGKWFFVAGRTNGLHLFTTGAFPTSSANTEMYVIDPTAGQVWSRSVYTDFTLDENAPLRSTNMQFHQVDNQLYMTGGYGYDSTADSMTTFPILTVFDVEETIQAIINNTSVAPHMRQLTDEAFRICGGESKQLYDYFYIHGGQDFEGEYGVTTEVQTYTDAYARFILNDNGTTLSISDYSQTVDTTNLHRRDMLVVPAIKSTGEEYYINYGGVFTSSNWVYTNPVAVDTSGYSVDTTYDQLVSQYNTAYFCMFDSISGDMYSTLLGGISTYYYNDTTQSLAVDSTIPFIDDITYMTRSSSGSYSQTVMPVSLPDYLGANGVVIVDRSIPQYGNHVIKLSEITQRTSIGYFFGGIDADSSSGSAGGSSASDLILEVFITPKSVNIQNISSEIPGSYKLSQNFPNPFNPATKIQFDVPKSGFVKLNVYNALGQMVSTLVDRELTTGSYQVTWDGHNFAAGIYFYKLETGGFIQTKKMALVK